MDVAVMGWFGWKDKARGSEYVNSSVCHGGKDPCSALYRVLSDEYQAANPRLGHCGIFRDQRHVLLVMKLWIKITAHKCKKGHCVVPNRFYLSIRYCRALKMKTTTNAWFHKPFPAGYTTTVPRTTNVSTWYYD